jgi:hypothetical protein
MEHFWERAHQGLVRIEKSFTHQAGARDVSPDVLSVLSEIVSQIPSIVVAAKDMNPELREKFMSLSESAAKVYKKARRPPRFKRNILCRIAISDDPSEAPQKGSTLDVSQRGASVETSYPLQNGQFIMVWREDTGKYARAKVVWVKQNAVKGFTIGLEILDDEDFWGLEQHAARDFKKDPTR